MEVPPSVMKNNAKKKIDDEPTRWERIEWLERSSDSSERNEGTTEQQEKNEEEVDDEAIEDDDCAFFQGNFESAFVSTKKQRGGLVF
ncbi:hypothetical protein PVK06_035202 [Gossypium arboreum]|uniref:Uncharacterized protein n=1 Tax=Gossypium arboreum TaxID=29729 RepID=A0ABR0NJ95_GOSAR|nr:hypothetical protein PVK06_035202 [Gossypium arboreum]